MVTSRNNARIRALCLIMFSSLTSVSVVLFVELAVILRQRRRARSGSLRLPRTHSRALHDVLLDELVLPKGPDTALKARA